MTMAGVLSLGLAAALQVPAGASAQLQPTEWTETATSVTNTQTNDDVGVDDTLPEDLSTSLNGGTWALSSGVTYGPPAPQRSL